MRSSNRRLSWVIVLVVYLSLSSLAQTAPDIRQLELGKPIERELAGGEVHSYSIQLTAGQFLSVIVDQRGIDVVVALFEPDGKQIAKVDSLNGTNGEPVSLVAETSGSYRLEVRSLEMQATGRYEVRIEALRAPTPEDEKLAAVGLAVLKTRDLVTALIAAKTEAERVALLAREKELVTEELPRALNGQGKSFENQANYPQALTSYALARSIAEQIGSKVQLANALHGIGQVHTRQTSYVLALELTQKSLAIRETIGDKVGIADSLNLIGFVYSQQGNYAQALEFHRKSLTMSEEVGYKAGIAKSLSNIGLVHSRQGNYALALEFFQKGVALAETLTDKTALAQLLNNIGTVHLRQGNYSQALKFYQKVLNLAETLAHKLLRAQALNNIGIIHQQQGNFAQALEFYQKSLKLSEEMGEKAEGRTNLLTNIGTVYRDQGNYDRAVEFGQKSLKLAEASGNKSSMAHALNSIATAYMLQGNNILALEYFQKSLTLAEALGTKEGVALTLSYIGMLYERQGNYTEALKAASRAADIARPIGYRLALQEARTTAGISYRALGQPAQARQAFEEAIAVIESVRASVSGQGSRASYFATVQKPYELYTDLLMQLHKQHPSEGHDATAWQTSERARARSLLETLSEARVDIRQGVDLALLQRERTLQQQLNAKAQNQTRLLSGKHTAEQAAAATKEIDALTAEFQDIQAQIQQQSPRYAALTQPVPLNLIEIQQLLDADTLLLEYALGEETSYLWAVTSTSISSFELPKRAEIETAVRSAVNLLSDGKQWATSDRIQAEYAELAGRLSQTLLAPVAAQLKGKRLLIVGDGALQYLPFGALPSPKSKVQGPKSSYRQPLIVEHEIVSLPSASTLAVLRRETANRERPTKSIAVLADPVFEQDDERLNVAATGNQTVSKAGASSASNDTNSELANSRYLLERAFGLGLQPATGENGASREILRIPRLPFTRREADAILAVAPAGEGMKALDFRASRETATNAEIGQYRIVHFATHGLLNSEHPELSGIVLSLVNEAGQPVDGFLRLHEIYNLKLSADMVVLSACQTGLGKEIRGEGLVGLTRGFMYAGSPRVVASLWRVSDVATAELMKRFYQGMLREKMRPAAALRAAQIEMWKQKRWNAPFYWAAFGLQGEWK